MITEIYKFWVFWSKNGRFVTHNSLSKKKGLKPLFLQWFLGSGCLGQGVKGKIWKATQKKEKFDW